MVVSSGLYGQVYEIGSFCLDGSRWFIKYNRSFVGLVEFPNLPVKP